jgi:phosphodiesterase/alkaline phosphatase D-like protein
VSEFTLAFGSCYGWRNLTSEIFHEILAVNPSIWLWLGDAAYTDRKWQPYQAGDNLNYQRSRFEATRNDPSKIL